MKRIKKLLLNIIPVVLLCVVAIGCGGDEETGSTLSFKVTSSELDCSGLKEMKVSAPYAGRTYKLTVQASPETTWSVVVESGELVTVTPSGEQQGDGEIQIIASANSDETPGKKGVVIIRNNADNKLLKFIFNQSNKELYFPEGTEGQTSEDFHNPTSKYNIYYMKESENVAVLWEKTIGTNPITANRSFDPDKLAAVGEEVYAFLRDELKFASGANSYADKYKFLMFVRDSDEGTAYGGGSKNVAMLWLSPHHMKDKNHNIVYHEMCHSFQYMANFDGAPTFAGVGSFYEMTSQWALLQRYPNWVDLEHSHFTDFMEQTHLSLGHKSNQYHSPYVLEYWANKHGVDIISKIWQQAIDADNKDFIITYRRLTGTTQEMFNEEIYDAAARFITWDLPHIEKAYAKEANVHTCELNLYGTTYKIVPNRCPQNYGYNGIKLKVPASGTTVKVNFKGLKSGAGFSIQKPEYAEWRYGFLAVLSDGKRVYGDAHMNDGEATLKVPANTSHLWLVVAATPRIYWKSEDNQWPYEFTLDGTEPDGDKCKVTRR